MRRLEETTHLTRYVTWQPDDGTRYTLVVLQDPHGGHVLWWKNGRSRRKGKEPNLSTYWTDDDISHEALCRLLARSMGLLPYDAEALAVCMSELGFAQPPKHGVRHFTGSLR